MKNPKDKTQQKEIADAGRKAKGTEPENQTSAKDAKKVPAKKLKPSN